MIRIYVEGGGDAAAKRCKRAFAAFIRKAGFEGRMPKIWACGSRQAALENYETAIDQGLEAILLVDSEGPVDESCQTGDDFGKWKPWKHLEKGASKSNHLKRPAKAHEPDCHLMVECTENWCAADIEAINNYFGVAVPKDELGRLKKPELISKEDVLELLKKVARQSGKRRYRKGSDTFELLENADPIKVTEKCPWARRFIERLKDASET